MYTAVYTVFEKASKMEKKSLLSGFLFNHDMIVNRMENENYCCFVNHTEDEALRQLFNTSSDIYSEPEKQ